jgi:hypothetical protein
MRFELLRQRVERAERRVSTCSDHAGAHRREFGEAWRRGWTPGRIVIAGFLSGFLVGRAEPLSRVGGARWLQMLGTLSTMFASLRAAAASADAGDAADAAAQGAAEAAVAADAAAGMATSAPASAPGQTPAQPATLTAPTMARQPAPAEAATELSER